MSWGRAEGEGAGPLNCFRGSLGQYKPGLGGEHPSMACRDLASLVRTGTLSS